MRARHKYAHVPMLVLCALSMCQLRSAITYHKMSKNNNSNPRTKPSSKEALQRKRSIIPIINPDDDLCLYRAISVSLAHKKIQEAKDASKPVARIKELQKE